MHYSGLSTCVSPGSRPCNLDMMSEIKVVFVLFMTDVFCGAAGVVGQRAGEERSHWSRWSPYDAHETDRWCVYTLKHSAGLVCGVSL